SNVLNGRRDRPRPVGGLNRSSTGARRRSLGVPYVAGSAFVRSIARRRGSLPYRPGRVRSPVKPARFAGSPALPPGGCAIGFDPGRFTDHAVVFGGRLGHAGGDPKWIGPRGFVAPDDSLAGARSSWTRKPGFSTLRW